MSNNKEMIRFFTFSQFHNKRPPAGSTNIRVNQLIKYWPEADLYKYGENPKAIIFQKVYDTEDYHFPTHFKGIKILDICDPDWLNFMSTVKQTVDVMDAITCPTESIAKFLRQLTDIPIVVIPDRFDLAEIPEPKKHTQTAKRVVWFGYSHNAELIKPAMSMIDQHKLELLIVSNEDPMAWRWGNGTRERYTYKKYLDETIYELIQTADFFVMPSGLRPEDAFKSNNKSIKAALAGIPTASTTEEFEAYLNPVERQRWFDTSYATIKQEYDVNKSIEQYKELIGKLDGTTT